MVIRINLSILTHMSYEKKGQYAQGLNCEAVSALITKSQTQKLTFAERDVVFLHTMKCRECRALYKEVLDRKPTDLQKGEEI